MGKPKKKIIFVFLRFSLLFILLTSKHQCEAEEKQTSSTAISTELRHADGEGSNLNDRMTKIEAENRQEKEEINSLKIAAVKDRKTISELSGRIARLEVIGRRKRPYRLLPPIISKEKKEKTGTAGEQDKEHQQVRFYGPATNCKELGMLGHTLNGYYLVKSNEDVSETKKIRAVYCRFKKPEGSYQNSETVIGNVDIKTKSVHFYVQRNSSYTGGSPGKILPFELERLNVGKAFNLGLGMFTAHVNGIYHFQFSGVKSHGVHGINVYIQHNGISIGKALADNQNEAVNKISNFLTCSLTSSLRLKMGDRVNLFIQGGKLSDDTDHYTHFTGWLAEEDL